MFKARLRRAGFERICENGADEKTQTSDAHGVLRVVVAVGVGYPYVTPYDRR